MSNCPITKGRPIVHGDSAWLSLASIRIAKPATKYQAPANATVRGSERTEANTPRLTSTCHRPGSIHRVSGANFQSTTASKAPATPPAETARRPDRSWHRRDPNDAGANAPASRSRSSHRRQTRSQPSPRRRSADGRSDRQATRLKDGGDQAGRRSRRHCRPIATKRRTGGNLAADCGNVGQRLVEIAHHAPTLHRKVYRIAKWVQVKLIRAPSPSFRGGAKRRIRNLGDFRFRVCERE